jgi:hypothetical protein
MEHGPGHPVLNRSPGIKIFQLDIDRHPGIGVEAVQPDKGRIADEL